MEEKEGLTPEEETESVVEEENALSMGVTAEEYDICPELEKTAESEIEEEVRDKEGIEIEYAFNGADIREGLKVFHRETIYKRNIIYSLLLLVIFVIYLVSILNNPGEGLSMFLAAMCVAVIAFLWYLPAKHIKKTAQAADQNNMTFRMVIYDNCIRILQEHGSFLIHYRADKEITKIIETPNLFLICCGKERVFLLTKRSLDEQTEECVRNIFRDKMGDKYLDKTAVKKQSL